MIDTDFKKYQTFCELKLVIIWELKHVEDVEGEECWKDDLDDKVSKIDDGSTDLW